MQIKYIYIFIEGKNNHDLETTGSGIVQLQGGFKRNTNNDSRAYASQQENASQSFIKLGGRILPLKSQVKRTLVWPLN